MADELHLLPATEALARFRARTLSPVELLDALLARAEVLDGGIGAVVAWRRDAAYAAAREAEARYAGHGGGPPRPLEGVPVALKEEQPIAGEPLESGSLLGRGEIATETHPIVERIIAAGAVPHIRTATPEFSCAGFTHSPLWGVTRNPWNPAYTPGGSSGGSGAALAAGFSPLATGSDIGGSIRIPASLCGVLGYKPPYGRVPSLPPWNLDTYCHDGPLARTMADLALLQDVIAGSHPTDTVSLPHPGPVLRDGAQDRVRGLRVVWARTMGDTPVEPFVAAATARVAATLASLRADVDEIDLPVSMELVSEAAFTHYGNVFGASIDAVAVGRESELAPYTRLLAARSSAALARNGTYHGLALEAEIDARVRGAIGDADVLLLPTLVSEGWLAGDDYTDTPTVVDGVTLDYYLMAALTPLFNVLSRRPVLSVPSGLAPNGVPMGVQVVGRPYEDATVFDVGAALEAVMGWWADPAWRPPVPAS